MPLAVWWSDRLITTSVAAVLHPGSAAARRSSLRHVRSARVRDRECTIQGVTSYVYRGLSGTSLALHAPSDEDPTVAACSGIPLYIIDAFEVDFATETQTLCRRAACRNRVGQTDQK